MKEFSIYVHIPFCRRRCSYCDFVTFEEGKTVDHQTYLQALQTEIKTQKDFFKNSKVKTIYFGGGTPSLLSAKEMEGLLKEIYKNYSIAKNVETTIEVNPGTLPLQKLKDYQHQGINRFSLGVQTFNDWFLEKSGRMHDASESLQDLEKLKKYATNYSLDLMFGLPYQSLEDLKLDVVQALLFDPQHISLYNLTVAKNHELSEGRGSENEQAEMFEWIEQALEEKGIFKYEISNFAKPGRHSRHNMAYWKGDTVMAFGISAHSYISPHFFDADNNDYGIRFWNSSNMETYLSQAKRPKVSSPFMHLKKSQMEILNPFESITDFFYTRLRMKQGLSLEDMHALYPQNLCSLAEEKFHKLKDVKLITKTKTHVKLTDRGQVLSNQVFLDLALVKKDFNFLENTL